MEVIVDSLNYNKEYFEAMCLDLFHIRLPQLSKRQKKRCVIWVIESLVLEMEGGFK
jgi:hypothetical protein